MSQERRAEVDAPESAAAAQLRERIARAIDLHATEGMLGLPHRETAERMGRSEPAVSTLPSRALAMPAVILDPD